MMKFKLFVLAILFVTVSLLIVPDLTHTPVSGQADKSFKGTIAPFVPPSSSERLGSLPGNNFEFDDEEDEARYTKLLMVAENAKIAFPRLQKAPEKPRD